MNKSSSIEENNKVVRYLTEKIDSLELIENFYNKVQDLLGQGVDIKFPPDLDFNYHRELIKIRKQDIKLCSMDISITSHTLVKRSTCAN